MFKSLVARGFFFKFLATLIVLLYLNFVTVKPAFAISSLDSCMRSTACAKTLLLETGAKQALIKKSGSVAAKTISTSTINLTKGTSAVAKLKTLGSKVILFGLGGYLGEKVLSHLIGKGLDAVQNKVKDHYCLNYDSDNCNRPGVKITIDSPTLGLIDLWSPRTMQFEGSNIYKPNEYFAARTNDSFHTYYFLNTSPDGHVYVSGSTTSYSSSTVPLLSPYTIPGIPWNSWDTGVKNTAVEKYFNEKTLEAVKDLIEKTKPNFPDMEPGDRIIIDTDFSFVGDQVVEKDDEFVYQPQPDNPGLPVINPPGDGVPPGADFNNPGTNVTKELDKDEDLDLAPVNPNPKEEEKKEEKEPEPTFKEDCPECEVTSFTDQNFLVYASEKFITEPKFPFDIFGDMPKGSDNKCPSLSMFGYEEEFCFINESLRIVKYPIWIKFMFRMVFSI